MKPAVAVIVASPTDATKLNGSGALGIDSRAFAYGDATSGRRFTDVLVIDEPVNKQESDWLQEIMSQKIIPEPA